MSSDVFQDGTKKSPLLHEPCRLEEGLGCGGRSSQLSADENGAGCAVCKNPYCRCGPNCQCVPGLMQQPLASDVGPQMRFQFSVDRLQSMDATETQLLLGVARSAGAARATIIMVTGKLEVILSESVSSGFRCALACAGFDLTLSEVSLVRTASLSRSPSRTPTIGSPRSPWSHIGQRPWQASPPLGRRGQSPRMPADTEHQTELLDTSPRSLPAHNEEQVEPTSWTAVIRVDGMSCAACVGTVERASRNVEGVLAASVSLLAHRAEVRFTHPATGSAIAEAIDDIGFDTELLQTIESGLEQECREQPSELRVILKSGADAAALKESALQTGAVDCVVFTSADRLRLMYWPTKVGARDLLSLFSRQCEYAGDYVGDDPALAILRKLQRKAALSLLPALCIVLLAEHVIGGFWDVELLSHVPVALVIILFLAAFVTFYCGMHFHTSAISALRHRAFTMNTLVSLSTIVAFLYGLIMSILAAVLADDDCS